ncbi:MAG: hypothetical protein ACR2NT_02720 [Acidimicrobiia bacterium]
MHFKLTHYRLVPVSIVFAIIKQRLYDIDKIISRTLSYAIIIGALLAVYTGAFAVLTQILPVAVRPGRGRFHAGRYSPLQPIETKDPGLGGSPLQPHQLHRGAGVGPLLTGRLQATTQLVAVEADLFDLVYRTLQPSAMGLWIRKPAG